MGLFEGESLVESKIYYEDNNKYLNNPNQGFKLIKRMLSSSACEEDNVSKLIYNDIFPMIAELKLDNELEIYRKLNLIGAKKRKKQHIDRFQTKKILGIGGKFSSGKSCFINSITNAELPEGQRPTTSIATYIMKSEKKKNIALTKQSACIELDDEALDALTHKFYEKYKIGFSKLIEHLIVYTPNFKYPNIAILDTPGYSKSDFNKGENSTDAEIARNQLQFIDYLIWLVDSVQGVVSQRDLEFISSLNVDTPILFVFTKASLETEENIKTKVLQTKKMLKQFNKEVYDVIAYDSVTKESIIGEGVLEKFLSEINEDTILVEESFSDYIAMINSQISIQIDQQIDLMESRVKQVNAFLSNLTNEKHVNTLVDECLHKQIELRKLRKSRDIILNCFEKLLQIT